MHVHSVNGVQNGDQSLGHFGEQKYGKNGKKDGGGTVGIDPVEGGGGDTVGMDSCEGREVGLQ